MKQVRIESAPIDRFAELGDKLARNVYGSVKGFIRLNLIEQDLVEFCPVFSRQTLKVLDIGGGGGQFAQICLERGHEVLLIDNSARMLEEASRQLDRYIPSRLTLLHHDFLSVQFSGDLFDLVALHGSAEWMEDTEQAIEKATQFVRPGGFLSLLVYNRDRHLFKRAVSGQLLKGERTTKSGTLTPPGAKSADELIRVLGALDGKILLKSGIRVFQGFFRSVPETLLSQDEWLEQEVRHYRREPFASLGEHTHIIWHKS